MGADYYAKAIIGVRIDKPQMTTTKHVRGCEHLLTASAIGPAVKFCSECGAPLYKIETKSGYHPIVEILNDAYERDKRSDTYDLIWSTNRNEAFVGVCKVSTDSNRSGRGVDSAKVDLQSGDIETLKRELKAFLGELYKEENFGLWTVLYCSY